MKPITVLALGELLWDVFPDGPQFGGAPANFACSAAELGQRHTRVFLASAIGRDTFGTQAILTLQDRGVDPSTIAVVDRPTGQVRVALDVEGRASYTFIENPAWDHLRWSEPLDAVAKRADVVCFGTLGQRNEPSRQTISRLIRATSNDCLRILDLNLRTPFWDRDIIVQSLAMANVLKLNDEELPILATLLNRTGTQEAILCGIMADYSLNVAAMTCGASGSSILGKNGERSEIAGKAVTVVDTVGAGDAYTAALALGLSFGLPLDTIDRWGTAVAAFACTQAGGTPRFPAEYRLEQFFN